MSLDPVLVAVFLAGLFGGTHCFGMCGGIVATLSAATRPGDAAWSRHVAYNLGRIGSYGLAGAIAGLAGSAVVWSGTLWPRLVLMAIAGVLMVGMGAYLLGLPQLVRPLEALGGRFWRRVQPAATRLLPVRSVAGALLLGFVWGWLPCGLVYAALATALATGTAGLGATTMLAFGLGTLPNLLLAGVFAARLRPYLQSSAIRQVAGVLILGLGVSGLLGVWRMAHAVH